MCIISFLKLNWGNHNKSILISYPFQKNAFVIMTNLVFGLLAMFHLTYLGLMFDGDSGQEEVGV